MVISPTYEVYSGHNPNTPKHQAIPPCPEKPGENHLIDSCSFYARCTRRAKKVCHGRGKRWARGAEPGLLAELLYRVVIPGQNWDLENLW
jgi:hypothetical protein